MVFSFLQYDSLLKDLMHFYDNIGNSQIVMDMISGVYQLIHKKDGDKGNQRSSCVNLKRKMNAWIMSTDHFVNQLDSNYSLYQDIVAPIKHSLVQVSNTRLCCY